MLTVLPGIVSIETIFFEFNYIKVQKLFAKIPYLVLSYIIPIVIFFGLITLLRIPYLCHFGSTSFVLQIRPKYGILNRNIRVILSKLPALFLDVSKVFRFL